jgi:hypothetical protein
MSCGGGAAACMSFGRLVRWASESVSGTISSDRLRSFCNNVMILKRVSTKKRTYHYARGMCL